MISLNYRDSRPIYEQVCDGLRRLIVSGVIADGDKLPSVRALATQLAINPNTIQKAYTELERQGITYSLKGRGCFIASNIEVLRDDRREQLFYELAQTAEGLLDLGVLCAELHQQLDEVCQKKEGNEGLSDD